MNETRTKKETVEQENRNRNRNSQKPVKSVGLTGVGVYGGQDLWKRYVFGLQ